MQNRKIMGKIRHLFPGVLAVTNRHIKNPEKSAKKLIPGSSFTFSNIYLLINQYIFDILLKIISIKASY